MLHPANVSCLSNVHFFAQKSIFCQLIKLLQIQFENQIDEEKDKCLCKTLFKEASRWVINEKKLSSCLSNVHFFVSRKKMCLVQTEVALQCKKLVHDSINKVSLGLMGLSWVSSLWDKVFPTIPRIVELLAFEKKTIMSHKQF